MFRDTVRFHDAGQPEAFLLRNGFDMNHITNPFHDTRNASVVEWLRSSCIARRDGR